MDKETQLRTARYDGLIFSYRGSEDSDPEVFLLQKLASGLQSNVGDVKRTAEARFNFAPYQEWSKQDRQFDIILEKYTADPRCLVFGVKNGVTSLRDRLVSSNDFYKATETLENEKRPNATSDLYEMTPEESSHFEDREERD